MDGFRWLSSALVLALLVTGPLAPAAWAQQPKPQEETAQAPEAAAEEADTGYVLGAIAVNPIYIPGKLALCALGTAVGLATLGITIGSGYRAAARVMREGCGGSWVVRPNDLKEGLAEKTDRQY